MLTPKVNKKTKVRDESSLTNTDESSTDNDKVDDDDDVHDDTGIVSHQMEQDLIKRF